MTTGKDSLAVSIFNQLLGQYNGSVAAIQQGSVAIGKELFFTLALISVAVLGINRLLSRNVDVVETNIELVKLLIYLNVFYLFIDQFPNLLPQIVESFKQAAFYMGNLINQNTNLHNTTHFIIATNPGDVLNLGVNITTTVLDITRKQTNFLNFGLSLIGVAAAAVILFCFGCIAIKLVIIEISSRIILSAGIFLLAFSGTQWTRDYATRYIGSFFGVGIQMLFTYLLIGIGSGLANNWVNTLVNVSGDKLIEAYIAVIMATFVYYKISLTLPEQAAGYLSGGLSINTGIGAGLAAAAAVTGAGIYGAWKGIAGTRAKMEGAKRAWSAASQAAPKNSPSSNPIAKAIDNFGSTIKTLGDADNKIQQERWDSHIDSTYSGKLAQKIKSEQAAKQQTGIKST